MTALERWLHHGRHVVGAVCGIQQRFGSRRDIAPVQQNLADFAPERGTAGLEGAHHTGPSVEQILLERSQLGALANTVDSLEGDEQAFGLAHATSFGWFHA